MYGPLIPYPGEVLAYDALDWLTLAVYVPVCVVGWLCETFVNANLPFPIWKRA